MGVVRKISVFISKTVACIFVIALLAVAATSFSPVYRFGASSAFSGPDIYDPYRDLDTACCWKRANFHTHTKVDGPMNECEFLPSEVFQALEKFGYDIVTFSNHNKLTEHPTDSSLQVNVYEHGYNLFKFHKLVFGSDEVRHFDHLVPISVFQKQFQLDYLGKDADIVQINHPMRTTGLSRRHMEKLSGYSLIELDSGKSTENEYWDWALSAGHYSFGVANDDLHYPDRSGRIAVRCNFLCTPSAEYHDIKKCLEGGCFYSMRVPDYGNGNWDIKYEKNRNLPYVRDIGLKGGAIYMCLSSMADSIKVIGQGHKILGVSHKCDKMEYTLSDSDSYARFTAYFPEGEVIYSNPFARYDASVADSPFSAPSHERSLILTVLFNLLAASVTAGCIYTIYKLIRS